ncbi:hypothetical protein GRI38_12420 [Altererythrobacter aurantiacus]|uniref:Poly-gamma-glutamate synthase PgsB/CapB n=1 Tax=Parapontixanthobacter aurantiacus TaxID=1463599 RepID=A0A844ZE83_9SPHN|nr:hypothetical protein [Parapontixanthobacter aurantiacus]MXO86831.1 hypothetical protein [Parapontixanthobacter aurantiacus]
MTPPDMLLATPCGIVAALEQGLPPRLCGTYSDIHTAIEQFATTSEEFAAEGNFVDHVKAVFAFVRARMQYLTDLHDAAALFNARYASALDEAAQHSAILDFAERLGADEQQLASDRKALADYFDNDAVMERYRRRAGEAERAIAHAFERLGQLAGEALRRGEMDSDDELLSVKLAGLLVDGRGWRGDPRVRRASFAALKQIGASARILPSGFWVDIAVRDARRMALDASEDCWTQCEAFAVLKVMSPGSLAPVLEKRLAPAADSDTPVRQDNAMFVRRHLAGFLAEAVGAYPKLAKYLKDLSNDRSGAVRQALARHLPKIPREEAQPLFSRLRIDQDPQVRAMLFADPEAMAEAIGSELFRSHIVRILQRDTNKHVLRMGMEAAARLVALEGRTDPREQARSAEHFENVLNDLRKRAPTPNLRRWAGEAIERIWLHCDADALDIAEHIRFQMGLIPEGKRRKLPDLANIAAHDPAYVGRIMAVLAQDGFGLELIEGRIPHMQKGELFSRRLWRILFEGKISATDKRQAFLHTVGRSLPGTISAPPAHMAELAPTKVPGEPLHFADEGGWRNYLPLLDHVLAAIDRGKPTRIFTSEGITTVTPPKGIGRRVGTYWRISRDFAKLASLRNKGGSADYVEALRSYGLGIDFTQYDATPTEAAMLEEQVAIVSPKEARRVADPEVLQLFELGGVLIAVPVLIKSAAAYFATVFANTLAQLALFVVLAGAWFFGRHLYLARKARQYRAAIPLSLGGWGTRGKSGTERLKAGLINALGHPLVSKTTGCEAMFLRGEPFGDLTEMFLFRPYDKATIWEQFNLIRISVGLKARVFLWECMGLNPAYVRVLQQDWMRDDIGTITNTYPDHEDVQGPAGRNIPDVMCEFIPHDSVLLTTEEEMLPILEEGARKARTRIRTVDWREAGLVHEALLARFPYAEHPYNIALVAAMGDELGLGEDYCIKEMSDRVVADLGVLKIYPHSKVEGRTLEFVMGMSANERFGALGNWDRMGFAEHDLARDPEIFVSTVVNNRADRVPRSRVFARMLVNDVSADRHFLIGSNIDGLIGFIEDEWAAYADKLTLDSEKGLSQAEVFEGLARKMRIPTTREQLENRLAAMLASFVEPDAASQLVVEARNGRLDAALTAANVNHGEAIAANFTEMAKDLEQYQAISNNLHGGRGEDVAAIRSFLRSVFMRKLVPVRDFYMSGENIIRLIARNSPPGLVNRIMGMQNIKGTGLDFVYRWQAWEAVYRACVQARDADPVTAEKGLVTLAGFQEYGVLSEKEVQHTITALKAADSLPPSFTPAQLDAILARLDAQLKELGEEEPSAGKGEDSGSWRSKLGAWLLEITESFLDAGDAVRRRRQADRIYTAMIAEQISSQRAALELKKLTKRQKGGWLAETIASGQGRLLTMFGRTG